MHCILGSRKVRLACSDPLGSGYQGWRVGEGVGGEG